MGEEALHIGQYMQPARNSSATGCVTLSSGKKLFEKPFSSRTLNDIEQFDQDQVVIVDFSQLGVQFLKVSIFDQVPGVALLGVQQSPLGAQHALRDGAHTAEGAKVHRRAQRRRRLLEAQQREQVR
jgi:hypothetical protein